MTPTVGRIVLYKLSEQNAGEINRRRTTGKSIAERLKWGSAGRHAEAIPANTEDGSLRAWPAGAQAHIGNNAEAGQVYPMVICRIWGSTPESAVNGQVLLDGNDTFWATSTTCGDGEGQWQWPTIQK